MAGAMLALIHRANTTASHVISNISILRYTNITTQWGGDSNATTLPPNWGLMLWHEVNVYEDYLGQISWLVLFAIPFIMLWLGSGELLAASVMGLFIGIYVFAYIGSQYAFVGIVCLAAGITGILWSIYQKRG